jgi:general secretion pathway protein G
MTLSKFASRRRGFTLIELLIVIVVIAILALIVIPRLMGAGRKAKEASLKGNLQQLRNAISQFQADTGVYPSALTDLVAKADGSNLGITDTTAKASYKGPYLTPSGGVKITGYPGLPRNPFVDATETDVTKHWTYESTGGTVKSAFTGETIDKEAFTDL